MTGQCDFLRKFPNFLRKQGVSAHPVYPPLCLPASPVSHPSPLNHLSDFNQTEGKGLTGTTAVWVLRENRLAVRKDPNYCSPPCPERNGSTTSAQQPPTLAGHSPVACASSTVGLRGKKGREQQERRGTREVLKGGHIGGRQDINPLEIAQHSSAPPRTFHCHATGTAKQGRLVRQEGFSSSSSVTGDALERSSSSEGLGADLPLHSHTNCLYSHPRRHEGWAERGE